MACSLSVKTGKVTAMPGDAIAVPLCENRGTFPDALREIDAAAGGMLRRVMDCGDFKGERFTTTVLYTGALLPCKRLILVGMGKAESLDLDTVRSAGAKAFRCARDLGLKHLIVPAALVASSGIGADEMLEAFLTGGCLGIYQFKQLVTAGREKIKNLADCAVVVPDSAAASALKRTIHRAGIIVEAVCFARDLVSLPANMKTPMTLARQARSIARASRLKVKIITEAQAEKQGMGAFTAVAQGSREPAAMIILEYAAGRRFGAPVALVGKGITFDSGGISLKSPTKMDLMKDDMAGGAAVLAVMQALARLKLPVNVVGVIPATENLPGGKAYKPGDVVRSLSGQTIEVISTDAEGRLILADALTYSLGYQPQAIMDLATLTGACVTALGDHVAGAMGNSDDLLERTKRASERSGEKVWTLPLWEEYADLIKSDIADCKNVGNRTAGAIVGGVFLQKFVNDTPWVHLDIAGPAWEEKGKAYVPKGATGFGVRLLIELLSAWNKESSVQP